MKGLTLIEVLIVVGVAIISGTLLLVIIVNSAGIFYKQSSKLSEGQNINDSLMSIRNGLKQASAIVSSYTAGLTTYTSSDTQLVFKVSSIDSSSSIIENTFDYYVYFLDQNKLRFKTFPDGASTRKSQDQIFSTSVNSLKFEYFDLATPPNLVTPSAASKVKITLTLRQKSGADFETNTATSEAVLRNI